MVTVEINEKEKSWFFQKINKIGNPLIKGTKKKQVRHKFPKSGMKHNYQPPQKLEINTLC